MSVHLYLSDRVRQHSEFRSKPYDDGSGDKMSLKGASVYGDKGRLYMSWNEDAEIPDEIKDLVEEISFYDTIPQMGRREAGIYRHESAQCELTPEEYGTGKREKAMYRLKITAKKLEDIRVLMHKVKTGAIRPEESYEGPQGGLSRKELEGIVLQRDRLLTQLNSAHAETVRLTRELEETREALSLSDTTFRTHQQNFDNVCEKNARVRQLTDELLGKSAEGSTFCWPLVSRRGVAERITTILDGEK